MRISDWSSDVCSSDLSSPRPTPKSSFTWSVIQFPFATPTPVRWVSPAALPILRAALRLLALPKRLPLRVLPLDPAVGGAAGYAGRGSAGRLEQRSEEHTSELQSLMRISYAVFCLKKKKTINSKNTIH